MERAEEPVAAPVAGEHPARSVAPVRGGRQPDQEDARVRIAEAGQRPRPVGFPAIAAGRIRGSRLAVAHEARAESAPDDAPPERLQFWLRIARRADLVDNHGVMVSARWRE